ncbi:MAG: diaminopimelate dehydrogenase [Planctomycetes bacterium]|nr:diaminopimelate dehydrogenase [Planctomycetota bacterium]
MADSTPVLVHGLGNIGRNVILALEAAPDLHAVGVVRSPASVGSRVHDRRGVPDFSDIASLRAAGLAPEVAIICGPSRLAPDDARRYLAAGLHTVDSFDIPDQIPDTVGRLQDAATAAGLVAVTAAGWDPGTDSVLRALFEAMTPIGTTFTNFGRGRSMGHSVAARAIAGVRDAASITIPLGGGRHARLVCILPEAGADPDRIQQDLAADPYFSHDPLEVRFVASPEELAAAMDNSHGVLLERIGGSGRVSNQRLSFDMRIDNPALTAQVMVASARAALRLDPGCYTMIDIPPVHLLPGDRMATVARLV